MTGQSNSEGMALAYKVLCDAAGIDCVVVEGRLDREEHYLSLIHISLISYMQASSAALSLTALKRP